MENITATEAQINANRQIAQKLTGPRTAQGNADVSKNTLKHGLFADGSVIEVENIADYEAYLENFLAEMEPEGMVETMQAGHRIYSPDYLPSGRIA